MKIPTYWVTAKRKGCDNNTWKLRGISYSSMEEARARLEKRWQIRDAFAHRRAASESDIMAHRAQLRSLDELENEDYSALLLEPVLNQIDSCNVITRNRYGVLVLNSTTLCFIDVDDFPLSFADSLRGLFGKKVSPEEKLLRRMRELCSEDLTLGARVYRTHKGWRIMLVGDNLEPDSMKMHQLCRILHADPLYEALCTRQQCWRARLTPKPYRVGVSGYPRPEDSESVHTPESQAWVQGYELACQGKAVCRLVDCMGRKIESSMVLLHDELTQACIPDLVLS